MACKGGPLQLGFKSTLFPTVFVEETTAKMAGINVEIINALAKLEKCDGVQFTEFSSEDSFCSENRCVNALSLSVQNGTTFADVDSIQLTGGDISLYRYSLPVDVPRVAFSDSFEKVNCLFVKELAMGMRFYAVYNVDTAVLLLLLLSLRTILTSLRARIERLSGTSSSSFWSKLSGAIEFVSRLFHVISIFLIVVFYQCYFAGSILIVNVQRQEFESVIADLQNGTRRLLIDTGVLMENEDTAIGPHTTVMNNETERLERLCNDNDDVVLLWDDQLFGLARFNPSLVRNCRLNRIDIPTETNHHPIPRLEKLLEDGENLYRNSLHVRRYIPARTHGSAFDAYRATFPSDAKLPAFLDIVDNQEASV